MPDWQSKTALVTGASAGLGLAIATALVNRGGRVALCARRQGPLETAAEQLRGLGGDVLTLTADVAQSGRPTWVVEKTIEHFGRLDFACPCAGKSMRGAIAETTRTQFEELMAVNFYAAAELAHASAPHLEVQRGHLVLIGSLATRVAPRFLGAYPTSKHPLAALAQQWRMERGEHGLHTLLVCPGPIASETSPGRYDKQSANLPESARKPGGGAKVSAIDPNWLAEKILDACDRRRSELIVPAKARLLFTLSQMSPRLGDWLLRKFSS